MLKIHEAWFQIAFAAYSGSFICNAAKDLWLHDWISDATYNQILDAVDAERVRLRVARQEARCGLARGIPALWHTDEPGRIKRLRFITSELRKLARR